MSDIGCVFSLPSSTSHDDQAVLSLKRCQGEISGMMKDVVQLVEALARKFDKLRE